MHCLSGSRLIIKSRCQERHVCRMACSKPRRYAMLFPCWRKGRSSSGLSLWRTSEPPDSDIPEKILISSDMAPERRCGEDICLISFRHDVLRRAHTASLAAVIGKIIGILARGKVKSVFCQNVGAGGNTERNQRLVITEHTCRFEI